MHYYQTSPKKPNQLRKQHAEWKHIFLNMDTKFVLKPFDSQLIYIVVKINAKDCKPEAFTNLKNNRTSV